MTNIHLVAFNVPFPANYGGVIDVFYKIKALNSIGIKVHLHCFEYGRNHADELFEICESVQYYKRNTSITQHLTRLPYIVQSRINESLLNNLIKDDFPILFEGLHCCGMLASQQLKTRLKFVRMHNVEWQYYEHLAKKERNIIKQLFFKLEGWKLKRFEKIIQKADVIVTISPNDTTYFQTKYAKKQIVYVPAFHPNEHISSKVGQGDYILFHGDLSVMDNEKAALFLIDKVFNDLTIPLVIAGLNPSERLLAKANKNVLIKANVSHQTMIDLLQNAQANILISFHAAGMKLKLLNALFQGRFCIVNSFMIENTGMDKYCLIGNEPEILKQHLMNIKELSFNTSQIEKRKQLLTGDLSNRNNALIIQNIYNQSFTKNIS